MTEARLHPTAVVDPAAQLAADVEVGPYAVIGPRVRLGAGARVRAHAIIDGWVEAGEGVEVYPHAVIGLPPQDRKYDGKPSRVIIGPNTILREFVTVHPSSSEGGVTEIGRGVLIMAYCHVAHDCRIGDDAVLANAVQLAGHCEVGPQAVLGGLTNVHQFTRIGRLAMTGAATRVAQDILPFSLADGHPARWVGLNRVGLRRAGLVGPVRGALLRGMRRLFVGPVEAEAARLADDEHEEVRALAAFVRTSRRGLTRPRARRAEAP